MYEELVKRLRDTDFSDGCPCMSACYCENDDCLIVQAANAIEELSKELMDLKLLTCCCCEPPKEETE